MLSSRIACARLLGVCVKAGIFLASTTNDVRERFSIGERWLRFYVFLSTERH